MPASADFSDDRLQLVLSRAVNHLQPKAARMPPLVSEHERVVVMTAGQAFPLPCPVMSRLQCPWPVPQHASCELPLIPKDSQLLRFTPLGAKGGVGPGSGFELAWGVPRSPADFAKQALISGHPRTFPAILPGVIAVEPMGFFLEAAVAQAHPSRRCRRGPQSGSSLVVPKSRTLGSRTL